MTFGSRLHRAVADRGPLCVGIDPHPGLLDAWGLADDPVGLERFARGAAEGVAGEVAVVKPQSAFFERHGSAGVAVLERVLADCRQAGALVLLDVKRGDIGSTSQAYADAYLDPASPLAADAVTVSPYLGVGALEPFFATADRHGAGVFVLALTSNPEGAQVQRALTATGTQAGPDAGTHAGTVAGSVLADLRERNRDQRPLGSHGAVVGATVRDVTEDLAVNGPLLAPGYGAQGGTVADLRRVFGASVGSVLPSSSRDVLRHGPSAGALRDAVARLQDDLAALTGR